MNPTITRQGVQNNGYPSILELPEDESLIFIGGGKPIKAKKIVYYDDESFTALIKPPPNTEGDDNPLHASSWFDACYLPSDEVRETPIPSTDAEPGDSIAVESVPAKESTFPLSLTSPFASGNEDHYEGDLA